MPARLAHFELIFAWFQFGLGLCLMGLAFFVFTRRQKRLVLTVFNSARGL